MASLRAARETPGFSHGEERSATLGLSGGSSREPSSRRPTCRTRFSRKGRAEQYPAGVEDVRHSSLSLSSEVRVQSELGNPPASAVGMLLMAEIIAARDDLNLQARVIAAAQEIGLDSNWAVQQMGRIVTTQVEEDGTLADMYAYAASTRPPAPGANPAACSDGQIRAAVAALSEAQAR